MERTRFEVRAWPFALLLAAIASSSSGSASQAVESGDDQHLSLTEVSALQGGANKYPYATLTLLYLLRYPPSEQGGVLYLEGVPSSSLTVLLKDSLKDSASREAIANLWGSLQWSPYSWSAFFVQVSWSMRSLPAGGSVFEFRTRLLSSLSAIDHPPLECPTTVLLKADSARFLESGSAM